MTTPASHAPYALNTTQFVETMQSDLDVNDFAPWLDDAEWGDFLAYNPLKQGFYRPDSTPRGQSFNALSLGSPFTIQLARTRAFERLKNLGLLPENSRFDPRCYFSRLYPDDSIVMHDDTGRIESGDDVLHVAFSVMLYLNDVEGGALHLPEFEKTVLAKQGNMVIFSADVKHAVQPIVAGVRDAVLFRVYEVEPRDQ